MTAPVTVVRSAGVVIARRRGGGDQRRGEERRRAGEGGGLRQATRQIARPDELGGHHRLE